MTQILTALAQEYPNGVSFDPMVLRLLRQRIPFEDGQIEELQAAMFQLENGLWFARDMILDVDSCWKVEGRAQGWLAEYGCFAVERLFEDFRSALRHIHTQEDCAVFLRHLGFSVSVWKSKDYFCLQPSSSLDEALTEIAEILSEWLEEADGTLAFHEIEQAMPHLTVQTLEGIRAQFLPEVHTMEIGGIPCWCNAEAIPLPEDFAEQLTSIVDTLVALDESITATKLEFALNLFYQIRFRKEYTLLDNDTFMRVCAKYYQSENYVFPNIKKPRGKKISTQGKRVRSPNTRFNNIDVPIGAKLVFIKNSHITCTVLDDSNQVEYDGKQWAISNLATHLLDCSAANGFGYFSYDGEVLLDRRSRLEKVSKKDEYQIENPSHSSEIRNVTGEIIGLEGRPLLSATWKGFCTDGTNPRVAEWVRRVQNGERIEQLAEESGYAISTMKGMISNYHLYFKVCKLNGITPEGHKNV